MHQYHLSPHVRMCIANSTTILLDLRRDEYLGLSTSQTQAASSLVGGWPTDQGDEPLRATHIVQETDALIEALMQRGLVTLATRQSEPVRQDVLPEAESRLVDKHLERTPAIELGHIFNFLRSYLRARFLLRACSLDRIVKHLQTRKTKASSAGSEQIVLRHLMLAFQHIRPFVYSAYDRCLLDSLTLVEFLSKYRIYPTWVIGVTGKPFLAHSWVQQDHYVLNGDPSYIRRFQRILVI